VGCYIWHSEEGTGRGRSPPSPLIAVPNVTAHPSTASVPITVLLYNGPLLYDFNVAIKGLRHGVPPAGNRCHFVLLDNDESCPTADLSNIGRPNGPAYSIGELLNTPMVCGRCGTDPSTAASSNRCGSESVNRSVRSPQVSAVAKR